MEQQPQQPIGQPVFPIQPQPNKNKSALILLGVVVVLILIVGGVWLSSKNGASPVVQNNQQSSNQQLANYVSSLSSPIKIIPVPTYQGSIQIFTIATFNQGPYAGKNLVWANFQPSTQNPNWNHTTYNYAYYISDAEGNPIAWDPNFIHDQGLYPMDGNTGYMKDFIGLSSNSQKSLDFLPVELGVAKGIKTSDHLAMFSAVYSGIVQTNTLTVSNSVSTTETGWPIVKQTNTDGATVLPSVLYYVELPFGEAIQISPEPDFVDANDVPQLTWSKGTTSVASYRYGQYAYGWEDCYGGISADQLNATLVQTGTTIKGSPVYEIDSQKYPKVYQCLHEKTKRYVYNSGTTGTYVDTVSYADFTPSHPMFFWKHPLVGLIAFVRSDVVPAAEKAKPVIYLYPQKSEKVSVKVSPIGGFLKTDPDYGSGWVVDATPNGVITNLKDGKQYPYLFWEGGKDGVVETPKQGFVVTKGDIPSVLENKLSQFGLNKQERDDFLEFWVPKLSRAPYYFITFVSRSEIDRVSPMSIYPQPDTVIRVLMDYKPLTQPVSVEPLNITSTERKGFTVVEWGGIVRN